MRHIDLNLIKGRVAEALVESIFRRAEFRMTRFGRESDLRGMLKSPMTEDFTPDFLAMKELNGDGATPGMYQTFMIEVKYRSKLGRYFSEVQSQGECSELAKAKHSWPNMSVIFVTDRPLENRSCFQVLDIKSFDPNQPIMTADLNLVEQFRIYHQNVKQHEQLAFELFGLFGDLVSGE